jgi:hypothetical protein
MTGTIVAPRICHSGVVGWKQGTIVADSDSPREDCPAGTTECSSLRRSRSRRGQHAPGRAASTDKRGPSDTMWLVQRAVVARHERAQSQQPWLVGTDVAGATDTVESDRRCLAPSHPEQRLGTCKHSNCFGDPSVDCPQWLVGPAVARRTDDCVVSVLIW